MVDLGYAGKAADRLQVSLPNPTISALFIRLTMMQNDQRDDELLISRILFLLTYNTDLKFDELFEHHQLAESINEVRRSIC